ENRREHLETALARELLARHDERAGTVVHSRGVAGCGRALRIEDGRKPRELLVGRVTSRGFVHRELSDGHDLLFEPPVVDRVDRALVRAQRPTVLVLARDAELP